MKIIKNGILKEGYPGAQLHPYVKSSFNFINKKYDDEIEIGNEEVPVEDNSEGTPETPKPGVETGYSNMLIKAINGEWETIELYNSIIATLSLEKDKKYDAIIKILQDITNEENVHVGQLQKALEILSPNTSSIKDGEKEADEQISDDDYDDIVSESLLQEQGLSSSDIEAWREYNTQIDWKEIEDILKQWKGPGYYVMTLVDYWSGKTIESVDGWNSFEELENYVKKHNSGAERYKVKSLELSKLFEKNELKEDKLLEDEPTENDSQIDTSAEPQEDGTEKEPLEDEKTPKEKIKEMLENSKNPTYKDVISVEKMLVYGSDDSSKDILASALGENKEIGPSELEKFEDTAENLGAQINIGDIARKYGMNSSDVVNQTTSSTLNSEKQKIILFSLLATIIKDPKKHIDICKSLLEKIQDDAAEKILENMEKMESFVKE